MSAKKDNKGYGSEFEYPGLQWIGMVTLTLTTLEQQSTWPTGIDCATCAARREVALETEDVLMYSV